MALRNVEDLQSKLDRDLSWRRKEISGFKISARNSDQARKYLFRAGLVMLAAHWEGFLKKGASLYLEHVFAQGLKIQELSPIMVAVAFYADVKKASEANYPNSEFNHIALAKRIQAGSSQICNRSGWNIKTEGNPGSGLVGDILGSIGVDSQLGMDEAHWEVMTKFIDQQLLRDRHQVAHGEYLALTKDEFLTRAERLLDLLEAFKHTIVDSAVSMKYRTNDL